MVSGAPDGVERAVVPGFFSRARVLLLAAMLLLLAVSLLSYRFTRESQVADRPEQSRLVDLQTWETAQALAALADTTEEAQYAREAERLADHDVDQAFNAAMRRASNAKPKLSDKAQALEQSIAALEQLLKDDQEAVKALTPAGVNPSTPVTGSATDFEIAKEQLTLDTAQLSEAQQEYAHEAGDERSRIQEELTAHEASMRTYDAQARQPVQLAAVAAKRFGTLAIQVREWREQQVRERLIAKAEAQARRNMDALTTSRNELKARADVATSERAPPRSTRAVDLTTLKRRNNQRRLLSIENDRILTQQQLAGVYYRWAAQVRQQHRMATNLILESLGWVAFILACMAFFTGLVRYLTDRPSLDRTRIQTLRMVLVFVVQAVGVLLVLFVIFGMPRQTSTIIGLATAGLTVALQDFIIAFLGWFLLMRKNGIRVGDWVEINGVGGEVVEIGLLRTAMLETGNWTDKGHPTGRRVTFINSFAIKGQYFNFSTNGQWMWDEIVLSIPADDVTYQRMELIRQAVLKETESDAQVAAAEWKRATLQNGLGLGQFKVSPAVDMRPTRSGVEMIVRYVTRATNRFEMRHRLYQCVLEALQKPLEHLSAAPEPGR